MENILCYVVDRVRVKSVYLDAIFAYIFMKNYLEPFLPFEKYLKFMSNTDWSICPKLSSLGKVYSYKKLQFDAMNSLFLPQNGVLFSCKLDSHQGQIRTDSASMKSIKVETDKNPQNIRILVLFIQHVYHSYSVIGRPR